MKTFLRSLMMMLLLIASFGVAAIDPTEFRDATEEARFRALAAELRCVMCQNQSLADSSAPIARDLRMEVLRLMREGKDDEQVKAHLVERYSEFVLYQPQWNARNALLWVGPLLALGIGALIIALRLRRRNAAAEPQASRGNAGDDQEW